MKNHKGFTVFEALVIIVVIALLGFAGWNAWKKYNSDEKVSVSNQEEIVSPVPDLPIEEDKNIPEGFIEYKNEELKFSIAQKPEWYLNLVNGEENAIVRFFNEPTPVVYEGEIAEITIEVHKNVKGITLEEFFNGKEAPNLFNDSVGGRKDYEVDGIKGYWFDKVLGLHWYTIVAVHTGDTIYKFTDTKGRHLADGVFEKLLKSFKYLEE